MGALLRIYCWTPYFSEMLYDSCGINGANPLNVRDQNLVVCEMRQIRGRLGEVFFLISIFLGRDTSARFALLLLSLRFSFFSNHSSTGRGQVSLSPFHRTFENYSETIVVDAMQVQTII